jgi:hypothetical protein
VILIQRIFQPGQAVINALDAILHIGNIVSTWL